jgi:hypothetical protein
VPRKELTLGICQKYAYNGKAKKAYDKVNIIGNFKMMSLEFVEARP